MEGLRDLSADDLLGSKLSNLGGMDPDEKYCEVVYDEHVQHSGWIINHSSGNNARQYLSEVTWA